MAGADPFLTRLRSVLRMLDDDALAVLATTGLLRRAWKDLEAARPAVIETTADRVRLRVADAVVEVPEVPARSTCSCPATGVCRHILAALVFLRDDRDLATADAAAATPSPESTGAPAAANALGALADPELQEWAGKPLLRRALKVLTGSLPANIVDAGALTVRFPTRNVTCRWVPGAGLSGWMCTCQSETVCEHVVAAVLAYQVHLGKRQLAPAVRALEASTGAPRTRAEVLAAVDSVVCELVSLGLSRQSRATAQRLTTLAVSAHGVDLPRLERTLKSLADELELALRRDAQASSTNILTQAALLEALRTALETNASALLVGEHRTDYHEVGQLTLVGVGARRWRSKGGYHGVTVYFWDESRCGWSTWSEARPLNQPGFDPVQRFFSDGPWTGCAAPLEASRSELRLTGAWRNAQGRLSGRSSSRALIVGPSRLDTLPKPCANWSVLCETAQQLFGGGLQERTENQDLVRLAPKAWGPAYFDPLRQELTRPLLDETGRAIGLWLPFTPENEPAVELLERHDPTATTGVLGALRLVAGQLRVQPFSLFVGGQVVHLNLQERGTPAPPVAKPDPSARPEADERVDADDAGKPRVSGPETALAQLLSTAQAELESLAEGGIAGGIAARHNVDLLASASKRFEVLGLSTCARPLQRFLDAVSSTAQLAETSHQNAAAAALLRAYYVLRLAMDQEVVAAACAGLRSSSV
jgi:hypothetical protein